MAQIKIKNFGPIKKGLETNNGFIDLKKVTVFIGNQGSGKSTIAKLISTLSWLEKALIKGQISKKEISTRKQFIKYCNYQNLSEYFGKDETETIEYINNTFHFKLHKGQIHIKIKEVEEFFLPKIMYVPSDRNLISAVRNVRNLKGLPGTLYTFSDEFIKAVERLKGGITLPINNVKYEYQKLNQLSYIVGTDYKIRLSNASSGFQSLVPLYIVSKYLSEAIGKKGDSPYLQSTIDHSLEDEERLRKEIDLIRNNPNLSDKLKMIYLERLSSREDYSSFLNIVEEPEQNLFPSSQRHILNSLLSFNNLIDKNRLVITTHSPYLINYITLSVKAESVFAEISNKENRKKVLDIVPFDSFLNSNDLVIYELDENLGEINILKTYKGIPSDDNKLNEELGEFNDLYAALLSLQKSLVKR